MKIAIVTDAWRPQINGVVTTLTKTVETARQLGFEVDVISAEGARSVPCPSYPEIRLALRPFKLVRDHLRRFAADAIHIATEGPLGFAARRYCLQHRLPFTTSYHTQFPDYIHERYGIPMSVAYRYLRWFHRPAVRTMVSTERVRSNLAANGFEHLVPWSRGVDTNLFHPWPDARAQVPAAWVRPLMVYVGRVAVEKNVEAFLALDLPGTKMVIGDGPAAANLRQRFPSAVWLGFQTGDQLARTIASADVFVFPSRTDTFGIVMLEAMACGLPVAAFPVQGPLDVVVQGVTGVLDEDLARAVRGALALHASDCLAYAAQHTWESCTRQFIGHLAWKNEPPGSSAA